MRYGLIAAMMVIAILLTLRHSRRHELEESTGQSNVMGGYRRMERMADAYINSHEQGSGRLQDQSSKEVLMRIRKHDRRERLRRLEQGLSGLGRYEEKHGRYEEKHGRRGEGRAGRGVREAKFLRMMRLQDQGRLLQDLRSIRAKEKAFERIEKKFGMAQILSSATSQSQTLASNRDIATNMAKQIVGSLGMQDKAKLDDSLPSSDADQISDAFSDFNLDRQFSSLARKLKH
mmetsp:Transcript_25475/g.57354  ORF Transcript_25475/g.57354 Transcript_25475/m.57354 type:complete len:232 (+) Transcript_25475:1-696(+)